MAEYIARRLVEACLVVLLASLLVFTLMHLMPGDPAATILGEEATEDQIAQMRDELGLNDPFVEQFGQWWWKLTHGDLGTSFRTKQPVQELIIRSAVPTIELAVSAYALTIVLGTGLGTIAGAKTGSLWDWALSASTVVFIAIPNFVFGILALYLISYKLGWLPVGGRVAVWDDPVRGFQSLVLPALTLGLTQASVLGRYTRTTVSQVMNEQFVITARAKGLTERAVILRHVLRNSLTSTITISGLQVAGILTGSVVIERVFSRPGLGRLIVDSIQSRDIVTVQGVLLVLVFVFIVVNLVSDLLYAATDPRIRLG